MCSHGVGTGLDNVLVRVSIVMERHHDHGSSHKGKLLTGAGLQFRGFVHYQHGGEHGGTQADMVLESG